LTSDAAKARELDGNEVAADGSGGTLYMYGLDANRLFETVKPYWKDARSCVVLE